ncbi:Hypothetical protein D9617_13g098660 [Elsinoe fawcettii]|nr:Hypothetical protein D9617_13g098660 [Elsinoe fawcettii]
MASAVGSPGSARISSPSSLRSHLRPSPDGSPSRSGKSSPALSHSPARGDVTARDRHEAYLWMKDVEHPWDPCILTLDGGGIRGFSSALILKRLMEEIYACEIRLERKEGPAGGINSQATAYILPNSADELLPCHYFDFMYGTSTGGLIAVMLARLRMDITQCLQQYREVGEQLFGHRKSIIPFMTKYKCEPLEVAVKGLVRERRLGQWHPWDEEFRRDSVHEPASNSFMLEGVDARDMAGPSDVSFGRRSHVDSVFTDHLTTEPERIPKMTDSIISTSTVASKSPRWDPNAPRVCQSCCLTAIHVRDKDIQKAHLLRSYPHRYTRELPAWITPYNSGADKLEIWQVTRATSAAPFYFDMLTAIVDNEPRGHKDGGIRENNPAGAAYSEFASLYRGKEKPALMLSIGTGRPEAKSDGFMSALPWPFGRISLLSKIAENISVIPHLLVKYTESEDKHQEMLRYARGENTWYKRLNVSDGLGNMPLDHWVKGIYQGTQVPGGASLTRMEEATQRYLSRDVDDSIEMFDAPKEMIKQTAEKLVRVRRARERLGGPHWETFLGRDLENQMIRPQPVEGQATAGA